MTNQKQSNTNITNIDDLQNVLGVTITKKTKSNRKLTEKGQVMYKVNEAMHKMLIENFPQHYKQIETDVVITSKEGTNAIQRVNGWYLLFPKEITKNNKKHQAFEICKPTIYLKGGNSYTCFYFKEIGKTTFNK